MGTGIDLQSAAYNPYKTTFGLSQGLEEAAQQPFNLSSALAGRVSVGNTTGISGLMAANNSAAALNYNANRSSPLADSIISASRNPQLVSGIQNWMTGGPEELGNASGYWGS
jgi:hypothetical protein